MAVVAVAPCVALLPGCAPPDPGEERAYNAFLLVHPGNAGTWTSPGQVSRDGSVVVGFAGPSEGNALDVFHWSVRGGALGRLVALRPPGLKNDAAGSVFSVGLSGDATTVLGTAFQERGNPELSLFTWTATTGMLDLGPLVGQTVADVQVLSSRSGEVVTATANARAFRWSRAEGRVDLGTLPGDASSAAVAISADGGVIVGNSLGTDGTARVFRWTATGGMRALDTSPVLSSLSGGVSCRTFGQLSDDGRVLFGRCASRSSTSESGEGASLLFRWVAGGSATVIDVPAQFAGARLGKASIDGTVLVGVLDAGSAGTSALFRWSARGTTGGQGAAAGLVVLPAPEGFGECEAPQGLSEDGSVVLAACRTTGGDATYAVKWDAVGAGAILAPLAGFAESHPSSISADGQVVAGYARQRAGPVDKYGIDTAMVWDSRRGGPQRMSDRLRAEGLTPGGGKPDGLQIVSAQVSGDAHTFFGEALDARGKPSSWIARLP